MASVTGLLAEIADVGRDRRRGGYTRPVYSTAERDLRHWFAAAATSRGLDVAPDRNGILWAWWDTPTRDRTGAVVTGSHLDSVPGGGAFDGPLGVASALAAIDLMRDRGEQPAAPIAIAVFPEEEGSRYGIACLGSRLMTGDIDPDRARALRDPDGGTFAEHCAAAGIDPEHLGADPAALSQIATFIELHVEQGRGLIDLAQPVAIGSTILAHGRWRVRIHGQGNHAGTTLMRDRRDPMIPTARAVLAVQELATTIADARATIGRLQPVPGGTNVIASHVDLWLDARHPDDHVARGLVESLTDQIQGIAAESGCTVTVEEESFSSTVAFDTSLSRQLQAVLPDAPVMDTGAGHDAGVLAGHIPSAMLFVRNPTGISHSPEEHVADQDAEAGAQALATVLSRAASHDTPRPEGHTPKGEQAGLPRDRLPTPLAQQKRIPMTTTSRNGIVTATLVGDQVYDFLENEILTGHLGGGTRLRVRQLAEMVGTSVQPVRDAIGRLEEVGLAERQPNRGSVVKEFSIPELIEIYAVRTLLEVEAAREGVAAVSDDGLIEMRAALDEMEGALQTGRIGGAMAADSQMLRVLYRASGNTLLGNLIETLWKQCHYYRIVGATTAHENNDDSIWEPTRQLFTAASNHDSQSAAEITRDSLDTATQRLKSLHSS